MTIQKRTLFPFILALFLLMPLFASGEVTLSLEESVTNSSATTTEIVLYASTDLSLNVFEVTLNFSTNDIELSEVDYVSALCEPRFLIEERIDTVEGTYYVACGTTTPFSSIEPVPILTLRYLGAEGVVIGEQTSFYQHDGLGTEADWNLAI